MAGLDLSESYESLLVDKSDIGTGDQIYTLPALSGVNDKDVYHFKNNGTGTFTIVGAGSETIDEQVNKILVEDNESVILKKDTNSNWSIVSNGGGGSGSGTSVIIVDDKTGDYTVDATDESKLLKVDTSGGDITITMPDSATSDDGFNVRVRNVGSGILTIVKSGSDTVDGGDSVIVNPQEFYSFTNDITDNDWIVYTKEVDAIIGDVSHFIGLYEVDGIIYVDIAPSNAISNIDLSKYNLEWLEDGSASWRIVPESITVEQALTDIGITLNV